MKSNRNAKGLNLMNDERALAGVAMAASFVAIAIGLMVLLNFFGPIADTVESVDNNPNVSTSVVNIVDQIPLVLAGGVIIAIIVVAFKFGET